MSCALRVNTATKVSFYHHGEGQQNGAGNALPLRLLQQGSATLVSLKTEVHIIFAVTTWFSHETNTASSSRHRYRMRVVMRQ
jgi:hypothetical protein